VTPSDRSQGDLLTPAACAGEKRHWSYQDLITTKQPERKNRVNTWKRRGFYERIGMRGSGDI
jgi:hypothetical protein